MEYIRFVFSTIVTACINLFGREKNFNNILIVRLDHIGDMVCTLQAISSIRKKYNSAQISLLTGSWNSELFINTALVNKVLIYNSHAFTREKSKITSLHQRFILFKNLRKEKYDLIIGFRDDFFSIIISFLIFPKRRTDRGSVRIKLKIRQLLSKIKISQHEIETNKQIVLPLLENYIEQEVFFNFQDTEEHWLDNFLSGNKLKRKDYAILHPGASWEFKRWSPKNFQEVGSYIYYKYNLKSVIIGTAAENFLGEIIVAGKENNFINLIGKTTLRQTIMLVLNSAVSVCNDSSPMHIAAQSGIPTIGMMGPAEIEKFAPKGKNVIFFHKKAECYPCKQVKCKFPDNPCVNYNTPDEVISGLENLINKHRNNFN
jgi:heptosyltransferase III